jgi:hypothetical protein
MTPARSSTKPAPAPAYPVLLRRLVTLLEDARRTSARTVNVIMTATYWQVGRHIVEFEQAGQRRAGYGEQLLGRPSTDLNKRFGRGFSVDHLELMRLFCHTYPLAQLSETASRKLLPATPSDISESPIRKSSTALIPANSESVIRKFSVVEWSQAFPLCSEKDRAVARYALAGLDNKIHSAEYRLALPSEKALTAELEQTRRALELRRATPSKLRRAKRPKR